MEPLFQEIVSGPDLPLSVIVARSVGALTFAAIIGFERKVDGRPAGLRTHMLISLAACVYSLIMLSLLSRADDMGDVVRMDPIRIVEAVTQGVAFLAAGLVVFTKGTVRGLTTGASMWLCAAVGLACGIGEWILAGLTTILALTVISLIRFGEKKAGTYEPGHVEQKEQGEDHG